MKKVIDGKTYNTDTAVCVRGCYGGNYSDAYYAGVGIYRRKDGKYFAHGEGGALSDFREYRYDYGSPYTVWGEQIWLIDDALAEELIAKDEDGDFMYDDNDIYYVLVFKGQTSLEG